MPASHHTWPWGVPVTKGQRFTPGSCDRQRPWSKTLILWCCYLFLELSWSAQPSCCSFASTSTDDCCFPTAEVFKILLFMLLHVTFHLTVILCCQTKRRVEVKLQLGGIHLGVNPQVRCFHVGRIHVGVIQPARFTFRILSTSQLHHWCFLKCVSWHKALRQNVESWKENKEGVRTGPACSGLANMQCNW